MLQDLPYDSTLNQNINKEMIWRRNAPYFYQTLFVSTLEWPSLTVEWWIEENTNNKTNLDQSTLCHLTYGTHTSNEDKNYLIMAKVYIPNQNYIKKMNKDKHFKPSDAIKKNENQMEDKILVQHEIQHEGQVNRIKHHPRKTNLIAARTPLGEVHIFDKTKFKTGRVKVPPAIILSGHQTEGFALEWNQNRDGHILAGSYDTKLSLWDINSKQQGNKILPLCYFNFHQKQIQDITYHHFHDSIFASCDDEAQVVLWDTRNSMAPVYHMKKHEGTVYSVQFSPHNQHIFASGGSDKVIKLWDVRNLSESLYDFIEPSCQQIGQLKWSPEDPTLLWSVAGNMMTMWNVNQQKPKFVHAGHMQRINQMDLHPFQPDTVVSVDQNNQIQIFQPNKNCKN